MRSKIYLSKQINVLIYNLYTVQTVYKKLLVSQLQGYVSFVVQRIYHSNNKTRRSEQKTFVYRIVSKYLVKNLYIRNCYEVFIFSIQMKTLSLKCYVGTLANMMYQSYKLKFWTNISKFIHIEFISEFDTSSLFDNTGN